MSYVSYGQGCDQDLDQHFCGNCPEDSELAGIRHEFYYKKNFAFADPTSTAEWEAAILAGNVVIIPNTSGASDGGTPVEGDGFGDFEKEIIGYNYKVATKDKVYAKNADFYNSLSGNKNYCYGYVTETKVHLSGSVATTTCKPVIGADKKTKVMWEKEISFFVKNHPIPHDKPADIFDCFQLQ